MLKLWESFVGHCPFGCRSLCYFERDWFFFVSKSVRTRSQGTRRPFLAHCFVGHLTAVFPSKIPISGSRPAGQRWRQ